MCDCFHLAFPNWHGSPDTGAGRRLRGPEQNAEDDSVSEEPTQFIEGERPRPQGSSPVDEYPETDKYTDADKQGAAELYGPLHKGGGGKKVRRVGFGSLFEKRGSAKMSQLEEIHSPECGLIVKTAREACGEGLVVSGGGKDGIFIKEVRPESPASKNLSMKEGDQILSATVYFDNVTYEDALQILEHAQPYKMEFCLKRKPPETATLESEPTLESETTQGEECSSPEMRGKGKTKRHGDARISWPKFPSFGKGRKSRFKRSHSSSEADEQRKLELSPTTSDTESPIKSQEAVKAKTKRHRIKISGLKIKGRKSKSVDQPDEDAEAPTTGPVEGMEKQQPEDATNVHSPEGVESTSGETPQVYVLDTTEQLVSITTKNDYTDLTGSGTTQQHHKVELISLDTSLKTTDITIALANQEIASVEKSPEGKKKKKKERSELKFKIKGKEKADGSPKSKSKHKQDVTVKASPKRMKTPGASVRISDPFAYEEVSHTVVSHTDQEGHQLLNDINAPLLSITPVMADTEMNIPKVDLSLDMSDVGLLRKSPQIGKEKVCGLLPSTAEVATGVVMEPAMDITDSHVEIQPTKISTEANVELSRKTTPTKYKLPKIPADIVSDVTIIKTDVNVVKSKTDELLKTQLPKREDIEIPGMEDVSSTGTKTQVYKLPKVAFTDPIEDEIQAQTVQGTIDVDRVREAVAKLPGYKLPKLDTSGLPPHREITKIDVNAKIIHKSDMSASPEMLSRTTVTTIKLPKNQFPDLGTHDPITVTHVEDGATNFTKILKREDLEIPGMEAIKRTGHSQIPHIELQNVEVCETGERELSQGTLSPFASNYLPQVTTPLPSSKDTEQKAVIDNQKSCDNIDDNLMGSIDKGILEPETSTKGSDQRSKKGKIGFGIAKPDIRFPDIGIDISMKKADIKDTDMNMPEAEINLKAPEVDVSLPKVDISLPKGKVEVKEPEVEMKGAKSQIEVKDIELEGQGSKFKLPKFGKKPKVKGPEIGLGMSKTDVDVTLPEAKGDVQLADIDVIAPSSGVTLRDKASKDIDVKGKKLRISFPNIGFTKPDVEVPEVDVSLPKVDISLPGGNVEVREPEMEIKTSGEVTLRERASKDIDVKVKKQRISFPNIGFTKPEVEVPEVDVSLPKVDISLPNVEVREPEMGIKTPESRVEVKDIEPEIQGSKFKLPTFGISLPKVKVPEIDLSMSKTDVDVPLPEAKAEVQIPDPAAIAHTGEVAIPEGATTNIDVKMKKPQMSFPKFGFSKPDVKAPEVDVGFPKVDISLPEGKVEVKEPEVEIKAPDTQVEVKDVVGSPTKFKMPTLKFPKFGATTPNVTVEGSDVKKDVKVRGAEIARPTLTISGEAPAVDIQEASVNFGGPSIDVDRKSKGVELEGQGSKFKLPTFGVSLPKVKGPEIDLSRSKTDVDVSLPKVDISLPEGKVEVKEPEVEIKAPETQVEVKDVVGSPTRFKMPTLKFPKFGATTPNVTVEVPDVNKDIKVHGAEITGPKLTISGEAPAVHVTEPSIKIEGPSIDVDMKSKGAELEGQGSKFKLPKFGMSMPKIKGPEIDVSMSKTDVDVTLPEAKGDVQMPDVELKEPSIEVKIPEAAATDIDVTMKKPRMSFPKFGFSKPEVKAPEVDVSLPKVDISLPEGKVEVKEPEVEIKAPDTQVEVKDVVVSPTRFKMPSLKFPKFGATTPNVTVEVPDVNKDITVHGAEITGPKLTISGEAPAVDIQELNVDVKGPSVDVDMKSKGAELEGQGSKFKLPKFGMSMPKIKGPEIDLSRSKTDVDVTLPEAKAEVQLPNVEPRELSAGVEIPEATDIDVTMKKPKISFLKFGFSKQEVKAPEVDVSLPKVDISLPEGKVVVKEPEVEINPPETQVEVKDVFGSPTRFKMPSLKFPKFGATAEITDVTLPEAKGDVQIPDVEVKDPSIEVKIPEAAATDIDVTMKKPRMSFPKFGFSKPEVKAPEVDVSLPKVDISLPEGKVEVKEPEEEIKAPETQVEVKDVVVSPTRFKMPTLKFPKFGATTPNVTVEVPDVNKDIKVHGAEITGPKLSISGEAPAVDLTEPNVDIKGPSVDVDMKSKGVELEGQGSKFKLPKFGMSMPKSRSKTDVDVTLPEAKGDVKIPDVELKEPSIEVQIPKGAATDIDVTMKKPRVSFPKFGFSKPEVKAPEVDVSLPKVDISLPEGKVEVKEPEVEIKAPEPQVEVKDVFGSPTRFKMPSLKFPKFGATTANVTVEVPDVNKDIKAHGAEITGPKLTISGEAPAVDLKEPSVDIKGPSIDVDMKSKGAELEGQGSKFKLPKFGMSMPKSRSKTDVDVTLPEAKAEVQLPNVEPRELSAGLEIPEGAATDIDVTMKKPKMSFPKFGFSKQEVKAPEVDVSLPKVDISLPEGKVEVKEPEVEIKTPETQIEVKDVVGSPTRFKMPSLKFPKFGATTPNVTVEVPDVNKDIKVHGAEITGPKLTISGVAPAVDLKEPNVDIKGPSIDVDMKSKGAELEGQGSKFKLPKFGMSMPKSRSKTDVDVTLPEAKGDVKIPDVELKEPSIEVQIPKGAATDIDVTMKKPRVSFPKFGFSKPEVKAPEVDVSLPKVDISLPEGKVVVKEPEVEIKAPETQVEVKDVFGSPTRFKMPSLKFPKFGATAEITDVTLPEAKGDVQIPDVEVKDPSIEVKIPEAAATDIDVKMKKPQMSFPKFGFSKQEVKAPEVDVSLPKVDISLPEGKVVVKEPEVEIKAPETQVEVKDVFGSPTRFKMPSLKFPKFGATAEITDVTLPEAKGDVQIPDVEVKDPSIEVKIPEAAATDIDVKMKKPQMSFPKFGFSKQEVKAPEVDVSLPKVDISLPEGKVVVKEPEVEMKGAETKVEVEDVVDSPTRFKLPSFKFPKFGTTSLKVDDSDKDKDIKGTVPEPEDTDIKGSGTFNAEGSSVDLDMKSKGIEIDRQESQFKLPKFGISLPKLKGPGVDMDTSEPGVGISTTEGQANVQLPDAERPSAEGVDIEGIATAETGSKDDASIKGSPRKFKLPTFTMPKFGMTTQKPNLQSPDINADVTISTVEETDIETNIKADVGQINTDHPELEAVDPEMSKQTDDGKDHGSPSKFKLSFKMPRFSISKSKPEAEHEHEETESKDETPDVILQKELQVDTQEPDKSSKLTLTSFGEVLRGIDVEFGGASSEDVEEKLPELNAQLIAETQPVHKEEEVKEKSKSKFKFPSLGFNRAPEESETVVSTNVTVDENEKQPEPKEEERNAEKESNTQTPEKVPWFKFPKFGLSSPFEAVKTSEKEVSENSPTYETVEDVSFASSLPFSASSDAFADISSTVTREQGRPSSASPTKVTVKYSDPVATMGLGGLQGDVITSTTRTERISLEPHLPEKITIPVSSSGASSSSVDTLKQEPGDIHIITTNIQAKPDTQHATLLTDFQVRSADGLTSSRKTVTMKTTASDWTGEDDSTHRTLSGERVVVEKHVVRQMSSKDMETVVITQRATHVFGVDPSERMGVEPSEPVSDETASSIQRMRDSMHTEKMKFFDGAKM